MHGFPRRLLVFSLLLSLIGSGACSRSPLDRAEEFLDAGMASQAVPLLQIEIQANPKNARAHLMLGQASLMLNDQVAAKESFDRAVLLNPGWADKVGRAYLDAANKLISGGPSETRLAVSYLETAREKTRSLDKDVARSLRRAGLRVGSAELLRSAVQTDAALAQDDSVAAYLAIGSGQSPDLRISSMEQFLGQFPKSALRPAVLVQIAQAEMAVGNRPKAKAYAQEVITLPGDPTAATEAKSLLEQIAGVERTEVEAGVAARQAQAQAQEAQARQKLNEQEAQARAAQAKAEAEADAAARRARREAAERDRQERTYQELTVSARSPEGVTTKPLAAGVTYELEVSGTYDAWGNTPHAVDAVACFADPQCTEDRRAKLAQGFKVDGSGLIDLSRGTLSYSSDHSYTVVVTGTGRPLTLWIQDAREFRGHGGEDNVGALTVRILRVAGH